MKHLELVILALFAPITFAQDRVQQYDFDQDGKVSFEDVNQSCDVSKNLFDRADKNDDGFLSNTEMATARRYIFTRCDKAEVESRTPITLQG